MHPQASLGGERCFRELWWSETTLNGVRYAANQEGKPTRQSGRLLSTSVSQPDIYRDGLLYVDEIQPSFTILRH